MMPFEKEKEVTGVESQKESIIITNSSMTNIKRKVVEPEGCFVAVLSSVLSFMIASGLGTIGIFTVELTEHFNLGKAEISWIGALQLSLMHLGGVILGGFVGKFGCMATAILATILVSGGMVSAAFINNIPALIVTLGLIVGFGFCGWIVSATMAVQSYYVRRRALATSVKMLGMSIGYIVWPVWTEFLIRYYSWRGALLLNAGIILHGIPLAMLLNYGLKYKKYLISDNLANVVKTDQTPQHNNSDKDTSLKTEETSDNDTVLPSSCQSKMLTTDKHVSCSVHSDASSNDNSHSRGHKNEEKPGYEEETGYSKCCSNNAYFELLCVPYAALYISSTGLFLYSQATLFTFIPVFAVSLDISKEMAVTVISIYGIVGLIARPVAGYIGDLLSQHRLTIYGVFGILTGFTNIFTIFAFNYMCLAVYGIFFGLLSAPCLCYMSTVLTDLVGLKRLPQALSIYLSFTGICVFISISTSGKLMDATHKPEMAFICTGCIQVCGGILALIAQVCYVRTLRGTSEMTA